MNNKTKLLITTLMLSAVSYSAEIKVDGNAAYTFNLENKYDDTSSKNKTVFEPKIPVKLNISFNPSEVNLKGSFNVENTEIDGKFREENKGKILDNFSIDGDVNYLSKKLVKGLRVASNFKLIALDGAKYKGKAQKGDVDLELGVNYDFDKVNLGSLIYYKSNAIMSPKLLGLTFTLGSPKINTDAMFRVSYNLGEYIGLNVYNPNKLNYEELKETDELYYYANESKINKLIPVVLEMTVNNKKELLENLTLKTSLKANLKYSEFNGELNKVSLLGQATRLNEAVKKAIKDDGADESEIRDLMKSELEKLGGTKEKVEYKNINFNTSLKLGLDYNITTGLDMAFTDEIGYKYSYSKEPEATNMLLTNNFNTSLKYVYEFEAVEGLSLIHNSNFNAKSEINLQGKPVFSIKSVDGIYDNKKGEYKHLTKLNISADIGVKYNIFETLSVKGGVGLELEGIVGADINGALGKYNQTIPKIFVGASYEW